MTTRPEQKTIDRLREMLPHGAQKTIAEELGVSIKTVYNTLQGYSYNPAVFDKAVAIAKAIRAEQQQLEEQVAQIAR